MQVSATVIAKNPFLVNIRDNKFFIISCLILCFGKLCGAISILTLKSGSISFISDCINQYIIFRSNANFFEIFIAAILTGLVYLLIMCCSVFGISGFAVLPITLFLRGFSGCAVCGVLYRNYSLQGIAFSNLILLPSTIVLDFILIFVASEGFKLSVSFLQLINDLSSKGIEIRSKCVKLLRIAVICVFCVVLSSVVEAIFSAGFIKYFDF